MTLDDLLNPGNISREQIAIMRANCDRSLLYFTRLFYLATERKKFIYNWHHAELCQHFQDFSEYKVATDEDILKGIYNIQKDKSDAFFSWSVAGRSSADSVFVLYDGPSQILWISGAENHQKTRLMARHGYYTNFGSFFVVWTLVLLMINTIHSSGKPGRRKTLPPGQR